MNNSKKALGIIVIVGFIIVIVGFFMLNKGKYAYSIEVEAQSRFVLYFDKEDVVVRAKCLDNNCETNIDINSFINIKYSDLEQKITSVLANDINNGSSVNIRLASGNKDISQLQNAYIP